MTLVCGVDSCLRCLCSSLCSEHLSLEFTLTMPFRDWKDGHSLSKHKHAWYSLTTQPHSVRFAISALVFDKSLRISDAAQQEKSPPCVVCIHSRSHICICILDRSMGQIVNFSSLDAERIGFKFTCLTGLFVLPIQVQLFIHPSQMPQTDSLVWE